MSPIHDAHTTGADLVKNAVVPKCSSNHRRPPHIRKSYARQPPRNEKSTLRCAVISRIGTTWFVSLLIVRSLRGPAAECFRFVLANGINSQSNGFPLS